MKTIIATLLFLTAILVKGQSYQYPKTGMVQSVRYSGNIYNPAADLSFAYFGDTILCGNTFSRYCNFTPGGTAQCGTGMYGALTRMVGSQIFVVYNPCSTPVTETMWYDWGLNVGNYFTVFTGNYFQCNVVVDSVYMKTMLNGQQRKYFYMHGSNFSGNHIYRWIEGIGDIDRGFWGNQDFEGGYDIFVCHQENDTLIWRNPNLNLVPYCHFQTVTSLKEKEQNIIAIYPNPTTSILNIVDEQNQLQNSTIEIKNYVGQVIFTTPFTTQIDISHLSAGMYLITLRDKENKKTIKIIKE